MMTDTIYQFQEGEGPFIATAVHDGGLVRESLKPLFALNEPERLREEDPFTGDWARLAPNWVVGTRSRFQVDLNRPRDKAVYQTPEDAWGLNVWQQTLPTEELSRSLAEYDDFYRFMDHYLADIQQRFGHFFVFDIHTYNHRRLGPEGPPADTDANPQVNVGTGTMDRDYWGPLVDTFLESLRNQPVAGSQLDVRENVKFRGGNFPRWIHERFPRQGCAIAIEVKKFFMDEWTGKPDQLLLADIKQALTATANDVLAALVTFEKT